MIRLLNNIIRFAMIISVIISFLYLRGCFLDKERLSLYNNLLSKQNKYRVSLQHPATQELMKKYYYSKRIPTDMQSMEIKGLLLKWIAIGGNPPMSGGVCVEFGNGKTSTVICTLDELRQWTKESPFYGWLGWWLLALSTITKLLVDLSAYIRNRKQKSV